VTATADAFDTLRGPRIERPFPLATLLAAVGESSPWRLCRIVGASGSTVTAAARHGCTEMQADRWAVACGYHPAEVWSDWYSEPEDEEGDE
jgi:hypothetical protein